MEDTIRMVDPNPSLSSSSFVNRRSRDNQSLVLQQQEQQELQHRQPTTVLIQKSYEEGDDDGISSQNTNDDDDDVSDWDSISCAEDEVDGLASPQGPQSSSSSSAATVSTSASSSSFNSIATCLCVPHEDPMDDRCTYRIHELDMPTLRASWKRLATDDSTPLSKPITTPLPPRRHLHLESRSFYGYAGLVLVKHLIQLRQAFTTPEILASLTHEDSEAESTLLLTDLVTLCRNQLQSLTVTCQSDEETEESLTAVVREADCLKNLSQLAIHGFRGRTLLDLLARHEGEKCRIRQLELRGLGTNVELLTPLWRSWESLEELSIQWTDLESFLPSIADAFQQRKSSLKSLRLSHTGFTDTSLAGIASIVASQTKLERLDLSDNTNLLEKLVRDQADPSILYSSSKPTAMKQFLDAIRNHPTLKELDLRNCTVNNDSFEALLEALTSNTKLEKLWVSMNHIRIDHAWVQHLPNLKIPAVYGFRALTGHPAWTSTVAPDLRRNTRLLEIDDEAPEAAIELACGSESAVRISSKMGAFFLDRETKRILARNRVLPNVAKYTEPGSPPLSLWPKLIQRVGSQNTDGSALFSFLKSKSSSLSTSCPRRSSKRSFASDDDCKQETKNSFLMHRIHLLEQENQRLRRENSVLKATRNDDM